jgi:CheY-like chemotaxis protein
MIVDDDEGMRMLIEHALGGAYRTVGVGSGQACLDAAAECRPDIALMDVEMPDMNGYDACRHLKATGGQAPPVIFISSHDLLADRMKGYDAGGEDYICKPFEPPELVAKIERQLAAVIAQRELGQQLDEAVGAVLSSADMVGEVGIVLAFQRQLNSCADYASLGQQVFEALGSYGFEGCLRIRGRLGDFAANSKGPCTGLELSILDHLAEQAAGQRIRPINQNTSFNFGSIILFVRNLPMSRPADMDSARSDQIGRAIDNVALLLEAAVIRVEALDGAAVVRDLDTIKHLVAGTREALADISARSHAQAEEVRSAFSDLSRDMEYSFLHLGLMHTQEEYLIELIKKYSTRVMGSLANSRETEAVLQHIIDTL